MLFSTAIHATAVPPFRRRPPSRFLGGGVGGLLFLPQPSLLLPPLLLLPSVPARSPTAGFMTAISAVASGRVALFSRPASAHVACNSAQQLVHRVVRRRSTSTVIRSSSICWLLACGDKRLAAAVADAGRLRAFYFQDWLGRQRLPACLSSISGRRIFRPRSHCVYHPSGRLHPSPMTVEFSRMMVVCELNKPS